MLLILLHYLPLLLMILPNNISSKFLLNQSRIDHAEDNGSRTAKEYKCLEYYFNSNVGANNLAMILLNSHVIDHRHHHQNQYHINLIRDIMQTTNVLIVTNISEFQQSSQRHRSESSPNDESYFDTNNFQHKLGDIDFFLIETDIRMLSKVILDLRETTEFNSRAKFIFYINDGIVMEMSAASSQHHFEWHLNARENYHVNTLLAHTYRTLWAHYIYNAIVMVCYNRTGESTMCPVFTWFPYDKRSECGRAFDNFVKLDECQFEHNTNNFYFHYAEEIKLYFNMKMRNEKFIYNVNDHGNRLQRAHATAAPTTATDVVDNNNSSSNDDGDNSRQNECQNKIEWESFILADNKKYEFGIVEKSDSTTSTFNNYNNANEERSIASDGKGNVNGNSSNIRIMVKTKAHLFNVAAFHHPIVVLSESLNELNDGIALNGVANANAIPAIGRTDTNKMKNKKFSQQFFTYNYRAYGLIEFRKRHYGSNTSADNKKRMETLKNCSHINHVHVSDEKLLLSNNDGDICETVSTEPRILFSRRYPHFFEKIPADLNGCAFTAMLLIWPPFVTSESAAFYGIEHKLIMDVARYMNFRLVECYGGGNGTDRIQFHEQFLNLSVDLAFGNIYPNVRMFRYIDNSIGYLYDHVNWVVPLADNMPTWLNLVNCFR